MWNRSMLRANRKIPESIPASAIATKEERGEPGQASVESATCGRSERGSKRHRMRKTHWARCWLRVPYCNDRIITKGMEGFCWQRI